MIITVTANPAYDVTFEVEELKPGTVHRVARSHRRPGGKGVNAAAVLTTLGTSVLATGFASPGFAADVAALGIAADFLPVLHEVRQTLVIQDAGSTTSLWENGSQLPPEAEELLRAHVLALMANAQVVLLSGSLPPGASPALYAAIARQANRRGLVAIIDTSGPALAAAAQVPGVVLMPNEDELAELCGQGSDPVAASRQLVDSGVGAVVATRGSRGLLLTTPQGCWAARPPEALAGNATGAGDAAAAAVACGLRRGMEPPHLVAQAVVLAGAAVASPVAGSLDLDLLRAWSGRVQAKEVTCSADLDMP